MMDKPQELAKWQEDLAAAQRSEAEIVEKCQTGEIVDAGDQMIACEYFIALAEAEIERLKG